MIQHKTFVVGFSNTLWLVMAMDLMMQSSLKVGIFSLMLVAYVLVFLWTGVLRADLGFVKSDAIRQGMIPRVVRGYDGELFIATKYRMSSDRMVIPVNKYLMRSDDIRLVRDSS